MTERVVVSGCGASTAIGRDPWASAAAVRAGLSGFREHPLALDSCGKPIRVASAPWLDFTLADIDRFEALLEPALQQALVQFSDGSAPARDCSLMLALPSSRPGVRDGLGVTLADRVMSRYPEMFADVEAFESGHAAGLIAIGAALRELNGGRARACIVAGVDSWIQPDTLAWLEACDQLHGAGPLNNAWGFVPGEGAAAILLTPSHRAAAGPVIELAALGVGLGREPNRIKTESVCLGEGLTNAFREALGALPEGERVTDIYCDMNGEPYRADEFGFCALRTKKHFVSPSHFVAPADCWGDTGACGSLLHVVLAYAACAKGYANGSYPMVFASAESGERAALLLASSRPV